MNIGEIEKRTGLTKANIRFYESEGLICPSRLENGYRDYTEENIDTLLKIKLLRELQIPMEKIRQLQDGKARMGDILTSQLLSYGDEREELERIDKMCRRICADGADYESLDAEKYLAELRGETEGVPASDAIPYKAHPWFRYFARTLDVNICRVIALLVFFVLPGTNVDSLGAVSGLAVIYGAYLFMFLFEPLFLHFFAATPGKLVCGIRVTDEAGNKLSYGAALKRLGHLFLEGMGLGIPLVALITEIVSCKKCDRNELEWDEGTSYTYKNTADLRLIACIALCGLVGALALGCQNLSRVPPNRGELTKAEFIENYNFFNDAYHVDNYYYDLDENGDWYAAYCYWQVTGIDPPAKLGFETDADGHITKVVLDAHWNEGDAENFYSVAQNEDVFRNAVRAVVTAQDEYRALGLDWTRLESAINSFNALRSGLAMYDVNAKWFYSSDDPFSTPTGEADIHAEIVIGN